MNRLQRIVRDSDTVARLGGDEFVVLLSGLDSDAGRAAQHVESIVEKIRRSLSDEYVFNNIHHHASASIGIKLILGEYDDPDQILKEADAAMYKIKKALWRHANLR